MIFNEYNIGLQSLRRRNLETIIVDLNANKLIFDGCSQPVALPEYKKLYLTSSHLIPSHLIINVCWLWLLWFVVSLVCLLSMILM